MMSTTVEGNGITAGHCIFCSCSVYDDSFFANLFNISHIFHVVLGTSFELKFFRFLKLVSLFLFFHQMKVVKNASYFILKAFCVLEIFKFLYFCLPLYFSLSATALEDDFEFINCLNKNLITRFV